MGFLQTQNEHTYYLPIKFLTWKILGLYKSQVLKLPLPPHTHTQTTTTKQNTQHYRAKEKILKPFYLIHICYDLKRTMNNFPMNL